MKKEIRALRSELLSDVRDLYEVFDKVSTDALHEHNYPIFLATAKPADDIHKQFERLREMEL